MTSLAGLATTINHRLFVILYGIISASLIIDQCEVTLARDRLGCQADNCTRGRALQRAKGADGTLVLSDWKHKQSRAKAPSHNR